MDVWSFTRSQIIGRNTFFPTPFGNRLLTYADYTASGRGVRFIERFMEHLLELYGNTHTEDDVTGNLTTERLHEAERIIKRHLNAGPQYHIIEAGTGSTGAIHRLQQMLGLYIPPAAKELFRSILFNNVDSPIVERIESTLKAKSPVVFVGPYEHHSNEITWRECYAEVIEIEMNASGLIDLEDLERKTRDPAYAGRLKIGSFSAGSNVTGIKTPVYEIARILRKNDCLVFFDFAAIAPYVKIDINQSPETAFDAVFFSPHKFLGGPGTTGVLVFHERLYPQHLPPTLSGGGTVDFVNMHEQEYTRDIETREKPGTPGILQTIKAALAIQLKERLGIEAIERKEKEYIRRAIEFFRTIPEIEIVGNPDPELRVAILSFNIKAGDSYLHPRYVVKLLNDLFGIQARAGCSCAGPYGHRLLHIDTKKSLEFKEKILQGEMGIKPGWARLNFHFLFTEEEFRFILDAVALVARYGVYFLPLYRFDLATGNWTARDWEYPLPPFGIDPILSSLEEKEITTLPLSQERNLTEEERANYYRQYLEEAQKKGEELKASFSPDSLSTTQRDLIPFLYCPIKR